MSSILSLKKESGLELTPLCPKFEGGVYGILSDLRKDSMASFMPIWMFEVKSVCGTEV